MSNPFGPVPAMVPEAKKPQGTFTQFKVDRNSPRHQRMAAAVGWDRLEEIERTEADQLARMQELAPEDGHESLPLDTRPVQEPAHPGIPEGTTKAVPQLRNKGPEGFQNDATGTPKGTGEVRTGRLVAEAKKSALSPEEQALARKDPSPGPTMDRNVRKMEGQDPERDGVRAGRAYKAAPRRSVYLPH